MTVIVVALFTLYILLLLVFIAGWRRAVHRQRITSDSMGGERVSVVIAARNESAVLVDLLRDIAAQTYPDLEIIFVDDHSEDTTLEMATRFAAKDSRFRVITSKGKGKKEALGAGIAVASGPIIVTTDADCRVPPGWIAGMCRFFRSPDIQLVFGGVRMAGGTFGANLQSLEFVSLIGTGAATFGIGFPTMCNGANLAFRKTAFEGVGGYSGNLHIPSGDDEFLLRKIVRHAPGSVLFAADPATVVVTRAHEKFMDFVDQRIRWAGKWRLHRSWLPQVMALFVVSVQCALIAVPFLVWNHQLTLSIAGTLWGFKAVLEFIFLRRVANFLQVPWHGLVFITLQFIYPVYTVIIGVLSNFSSFVWKGRKLSAMALPVTR